MARTKSDVSDIDIEVTRLELERAKMNSRHATLVLDKGLLLYFIFLLTAVLGYVNNYLNILFLNSVIVLGFALLVIVLISYIRTTTQEQVRIDRLIRNLKLKRGGK